MRACACLLGVFGLLFTLKELDQIDIFHCPAYAHVLPLTLVYMSASVLLQVIMHDIYAVSSAAAKEFGITLAEGANIAGFEKVAKAMLAQGAV
jgi:hypothetical protein